MILFEPFYRKRGIRIVSHLTNPPVSSFTRLKLPKNSSIHFPQWGEDVTSIPQKHHLIKDIKKIMFLYVGEFYTTDAPLNSPRINPENFNKLIRAHYMQNRRFRKIAPDTVIGDEQTAVCYTHGLLNRRYKYIGKKLSSGFAKWIDYHDTVFTVVAKSMENDRRNHFVILDVPSHLPTLSNLTQFAKFPLRLELKLIRRFPREDHWFVWAFWRLLHGDIEGSGIFKSLDPKTFNRLNIILKYEDKCTIINMARFLRMSKAWDAVWLEHGIDAPGGLYEPLRFGKFFLNLLMVMKEKPIDVDSVEELAAMDDEDDDDVSVDDRQDDGDDEENDLRNYQRKMLDKKQQQMKALDELFPQHIAEMTKDALKPKTSNVKADKVPDPDETVVDELNEVDEDEATIDQQVDERLQALEELDDTPVYEDDDETDPEMEEEVISEDEPSEPTTLPEGVKKGGVIKTEDLVYEDYKEVAKPKPVEEQAVQVAKTMARSGTLTAGELRRAEKLAKQYKQIKHPYGKEGTLEDLLTINEQDLTMSEDSTVADEAVMELVPDKSMAKSSLKAMDKKYVKDMLPKHMAKSVMSVNKMGVTVQKYNVDRVSTMMDDFETHTVQVTTVAGKQSTIRFRVPVVDDEGYIKVNGVKYMMRKQWNDLPIRKISATEVALTSYYSKLFVTRTERVAYNYDKWLTGELTVLAIEGADFSDVKFNNVFYNKVPLPREYTIIARKFSSFVYKGYHFHFDYNKIESIFGIKPDKDKIPVAIKGKDHILYMNSDGILVDDKNTYVLEDFLGIDTTKAPHDYAELSMYGKAIPLVYILGYQLGLGNLLKTLGVDYLRVKRVSDVVDDVYLTVKFKDEVLAFNKKDKVACLIVNGLNRFKNDIRKLSVYAFDKKDAWATVFDNNGVDQRYLKETQTMFPLWVDPITEGVLLEMGEPTDLALLMLRAVELLLTDQHPDTMDTKYMRVRGYERISGFMYAEMVKSLRDYNYRPSRKDKALTMHPDAVWYSIVRDESMTVKEGSNPIHNLKEQEIVVYRGTGGRSSQSMVAESRKFHKNAIGVVSEATVDSGDVGTVTYLSADPSIANMYGMIKDTGRDKKPDTSSVISTSFLLAPCADIDDPKRTGFVSVQNSQTMATKEYQLMPVRTGYERVIGGRLGETFCVNAEQNGVVKDIVDNVIIVEYEDGKEGRYKLGTTYHPWSGKTVTQTAITNLKKGDQFKKGETISYNPNFFKPDALSGNTVSFTYQTLARVAIIEGGDVYEDSCAISQSLSKRLNADIAHVRHIVLEEGQDIKDLLPVGIAVETDSILCTILNTQTDTQFYDSETMKLLEKLSSTTPKAKYKGKIDKIDVIYTGEVEAMPENLREVAMRSDRDIYRHSKRAGSAVDGGKVDIGFRVDGKPLGKNMSVIRVYIVEELGMDGGDKLVVCNQLKGTVARVWNGENTDEDGKSFDMYFSGKSIDARIVNSPFLIGTTNTLMLAITKQVVDSYFKEDN